MLQTTKHAKDWVVKSAAAPPNPFDGQVWIDVSGDNTEYNKYDGGTAQWEGFFAQGPDIPDNPIDGMSWNDTANDATKVYDGTGFVSVYKTTETIQDEVGAGLIGWLTYDDAANEFDVGTDKKAVMWGGY